MSPDTALARARTLLFVPGNRPERFDKALASGADAVVLDLEDSVPLAAKHAARDAIAAVWTRLQARGIPLVVRINALDTGLGQDDVQWLTSLAPGAGVMVPKADGAPHLAALNGIGTLGPRCQAHHDRLWAQPEIRRALASESMPPY